MSSNDIIELSSDEDDPIHIAKEIILLSSDDGDNHTNTTKKATVAKATEGKSATKSDTKVASFPKRSLVQQAEVLKKLEKTLERLKFEYKTHSIRLIQPFILPIYSS